jgi:hypothetical protein
MRFVYLSLILVLASALTSPAADLESRALTHYIPQDQLEAVVRKEGWTEILLKPYDGVRQGDKARIWAGGSIDHGNGNQPGVHVTGPEGAGKVMPTELARMALSTNPEQAYAFLFKTDAGVVYRCQPAGKPLEIPLTKGNGRLWIGFNDLRGRYADNHLGRGRRYELDPLWVRIEVIRIIVD